MKRIIYMTALTLAMAGCQQTDSGPVIEKHPQTVRDGLLTPEILWSLGRVSNLQVSPDGKNVLYGVQYFDIAQDKGNRDVYVVPVNGGESLRLTRTPDSESEPQWSADGTHIYFLYQGQLWKMRSDGSHRKQLTHLDTDLETFLFSPDESKLMYVTTVQHGKRVSDLYPDLDKSSGKVIDDLMFKHWDEWVETVPHPFVADVTDEGIENSVDLLKGQPYESPLRPFGGAEQLAWSPDGKSIAYTCRKKTGMDYALSTNSDIYLYRLDTRETLNLTQGMMGYDTNPVFSPDG